MTAKRKTKPKLKDISINRLKVMVAELLKANAQLIKISEKRVKVFEEQSLAYGKIIIKLQEDNIYLRALVEQEVSTLDNFY